MQKTPFVVVSSVSCVGELLHRYVPERSLDLTCHCFQWLVSQRLRVVPVLSACAAIAALPGTSFFHIPAFHPLHVCQS